MAKITNFTIWNFLDLENKYLDMATQIEERCKEIAVNLGIIDYTWQVKDFSLSNDNYFLFINVLFFKEKQHIHAQFNANWLFSDSYKSQISTKQIQENNEYLEYLRLKAKFEKEE